jgi:hypothetical protein
MDGRASSVVKPEIHSNPNPMKKTGISLLTLLLTLMFCFPVVAEGQASLKRKLKRIPGVVSVEEIPNKSFFQKKYVVMFEQPIDHSNPKAGTFQQRLFVFHNGFDVPVVFTTEGYAADYASRPEYTDEIADYFKCTQIVAEHRYFGKSMPGKGGWEPLTAENAAADHHRIVQAFKKFYTGKWVATGISKGGTTALIFRTLYPDDVDVTVPYVAPLNFGVEDGRHESFIATTGTGESREGIRRLQAEVLLRRDKMIPLLDNYVTKSGLTYKISLDELLDFLVLEYSFSFYQWGWSADVIPEATASDEAIFMHLVLVSSPDYFAIESYKDFLPFFIQAARQLGYYGYDMHLFVELMKIQSTQGYLQRIFLPDSVHYSFDVSLSNKVQQFLFDQDPKMIFIYGDWDPWFASAVLFDQREKKNMLKMVLKGGCHTTRIATLPEQDRSLVLSKLSEWLY